MEFIELGGRLVRESAITMLGVGTSAGVSEPQHYVYVDGSVIPVSELEYRQLEKRFTSKSRKKAV